MSLDIETVLRSSLFEVHWGYLVVILAAIFETIPLIGIFVPGILIVMASGFLVKLSIFNFWEAVFAASLGSILGDIVGYYIGKHFGISLITKYSKYFFFKPEQLEKANSLMKQHFGKSILIGRFAPFTRAVVPLIAGTTNISFSTFMFYNVGSGLLWAFSFVALGYIFGHSYDIVSAYLGKYVTLGLIAAFGILYLYHEVNKRKHIFAKYHLYTLSVVVISLYLFSKTLEDVFTGEMITSADTWVSSMVPTVWSPHLNNVMIFITHATSPTSLVILSILLFIYFVKNKQWFNSTLLVASSSLGGLSILVTKFFVSRIRPENMLIYVDGKSFPSGHATMATIFFAMLSYIFINTAHKKVLKVLYTCLMIVLFLLVGFSRVYLNVHWLSDVIAGFSLGLFWLSLSVLILRYINAVTRRGFKLGKWVLSVFSS